MLRPLAAKTLFLSLSALALLAIVVGCGGCGPSAGDTIRVDGSSTVFPITEAVGEEFSKANPSVKVTVASAGTGGGFKKFIAKEIDICDASRPITAKEQEECKKNGIEYLELQIAFDGLAVMVNPANTALDCITMEQLKKIWAKDSPVKKWNDVDAAWPAEEITLYGAGTESGTFDYFTEVVNGKARESRIDYNKSENDNTLATGIAGDKHALGYFGLAYYEGNKEKIKLLAVDAGKGCVKPSEATVLDGTYPLSRPLFIYVNKASLKRPDVASFVKYYLANADKLTKEVGYVPVTKEIAAEMQKRLAAP